MKSPSKESKSVMMARTAREKSATQLIAKDAKEEHFFSGDAPSTGAGGQAPTLAGSSTSTPSDEAFAPVVVWAWARIRIWPAAKRQFKKDKANMERRIARMKREIAENGCFIKQTPWPCKVCGKEPFDTEWHIGDDDATSIFDTETRICDKCYSKLDSKPRHCDECRKQIPPRTVYWQSGGLTWCEECKAEAEGILRC